MAGSNNGGSGQDGGSKTEGLAGGGLKVRPWAGVCLSSPANPYGMAMAAGGGTQARWRRGPEWRGWSSELGNAREEVKAVGVLWGACARQRRAARSDGGAVRRRRGETRSGRTRDRVLAESRDPGPRRRGQTCGGGQRGHVRTQRGHSEAGLHSRPRARPGAPGPRRRVGSEEGVARHGRPCLRVP